MLSVPGHVCKRKKRWAEMHICQTQLPVTSSAKDQVGEELETNGTSCRGPPQPCTPRRGAPDLPATSPDPKLLGNRRASLLLSLYFGLWAFPLLPKSSWKNTNLVGFHWVIEHICSPQCISNPPLFPGLLWCDVTLCWFLKKHRSQSLPMRNGWREKIHTNGQNEKNKCFHFIFSDKL